MYMSGSKEKGLPKVGIRELRQNLSTYIREVAGGGRFLVTDHNRPVALLSPTPDLDDPWERWIAEGEITPGKGDVLDIEPVDIGPHRPAEEIISELREDKI